MVFVVDNSLYLVTLDGGVTVQPLPGKYGHGTISTYGNKVAMLKSGQDAYYESILGPDTLWIFDIKLGVWKSCAIPEVPIVSHWGQGLIVQEDVVHILSVGPDVCSPLANPQSDESAYILHVRSGKKHWTHRYISGRHNNPPLPRSGCTPCWTGSNYDVYVVTTRGCHTITMTPNKFISTQSVQVPAARWHEICFEGVKGGIKTQAGLLWQDSKPWRSQTPSVLLINADYLLSVFEMSYRTDMQISAFRFHGRREGLQPLFDWETATQDHTAQIAKRFSLVEHDPIYHHPVRAQGVVGLWPS